MKVLGLIASLNDPSSRYRLLQYKPYLQKQGIELEEKYFYPVKDSSPAPWTNYVKKLTNIGQWRTWNVLQDISRLPLLIQQFQYDLIWQSRMLLPYLIKADKAINKPVVFDIDDAIWLLNGKESVGKALLSSSEVFAGNPFLADWCNKYNKQVSIIPTTVDVQKHFSLNHRPDRFTIGWMGTISNFKYLQIAQEAIEQFLLKYTKARFLVVSSTKPLFFNFDGDRVVFKQWNAEKENELINEFSVGIMPLTDEEWTRGKCGFKLLQYMACGKPVIASPVGINKKLLDAGTGLSATTTREWMKAFEQLQHDDDACKNFGLQGRKLVELEYSTPRWSNFISERFNLILNKTQ